MSKVNHSDIVKEVAKQSGFPVKDVNKIISIFIDIIKNLMLQRCTVIIKNFIRFEVDNAASKNAYDFQAREVKTLPRRKLPKATFVPEFIKKIKQSP